MKLQNLYRIVENTMAAVAFAEAGENEEALRMAFPEDQKESRRDVRNEIREENRPTLHC